MNQVESSPARSGALAYATILTLTISGGLVGLSYLVEGQTMATRTATAMVMPVGAVWMGSMLFAFWFAFQRQFLASMCFGVISMAVFVTGNSFASSKFMSTLQWPEQSLSLANDEPYRCAVVLGGCVMISPEGTAELSEDGERLFSAMQLYKAGKIQAIICTGATPDGRYNPSDVGRDLLMSSGIPDHVIFRVAGENTTQEMRALSEFFGDPPRTFPSEGETVLITSGFHMKRSMRLANREDLDFVPYPVAFRSSRDLGFAPHRWVPSAASMENFALALKERLAAWVGR